MLVRPAITAIVLVGLGLAQSVDAAGAGDCWRSEEVRAARLLELQNTLMIDALKCQDTLPATVDSYNTYLNKRRDMVVANRYTVQARFVRVLGPTEGITAATNYDTQVGNRLSASGIDPKRCETTALYARLATDAPEDDLLILSSMLSGDNKLVECPAVSAAQPYAVRPSAMVIPVWKKPATDVIASPAAAGMPAATASIQPTAPSIAIPPGPSSARTAALIAEVRRQQQAAAPTPITVAVPATAVVAAAPTVAAPSPTVMSAAPTTVAAPAADEQRVATLRALQAAAAALAQAANAMDLPRPTAVRE